MMIIFTYFLGASIGSFFCLVYQRRRVNASIVTPRSHCDYCGHVLGVVDLIPSISYWLFNKKCRFCHQKYGSNSFQVELYLGIAFALLSLDFSWQNLLIELVLSYCYLTDLAEMKIYTWMPVILALIIVPFKIDNLLESLLLILIISVTNLLFNGIGAGDILLLFPICLDLGIENTLRMVLISCVLVLFVHIFIKKQTKLAFVPYLAWGFIFEIGITNILRHL